MPKPTNMLPLESWHLYTALVPGLILKISQYVPFHFFSVFVWTEQKQDLSRCLHRACGTLWAELGSPTPVWGLPLWAMTWACGWIALSWVVMHAYSGGIMWTQLSALCLKWLLLLYSIIHIWVLKSTQLYQTHTNKSEMWVLGSIF